jgi:hypothetical protein
MKTYGFQETLSPHLSLSKYWPISALFQNNTLIYKLGQEGEENATKRGGIHLLVVLSWHPMTF